MKRKFVTRTGHVVFDDQKVQVLTRRGVKKVFKRIYYLVLFFVGCYELYLYNDLRKPALLFTGIGLMMLCFLFFVTSFLTVHKEEYFYSQINSIEVIYRKTKRILVLHFKNNIDRRISLKANQINDLETFVVGRFG